MIARKKDFEIAMRAFTGQIPISGELSAFFDAFQAEWGTRPVWAQFDSPDPQTGMLVVWVRTEVEARGFVVDGHPFGNRLRAREERVIDLFFETGCTVARRRRPRMAIVEAIEPPARMFAHMSVPDTEIDAWAAGLGLGGDFWTWKRFMGPPVVFVHTSEQRDQWVRSGAPTHWAKAWAEVVAPHDEYGFTTTEKLVIEVESKERFDEDFESNWFYFWH